MALKFHPKAGTILICDFSGGFQPPEMVKRRPVIVISPKLKHRNNLATVVPLSTTGPNPVCPFHCTITLKTPLPKPFDSPTMWVKGDMLQTVAFSRLDLPGPFVTDPSIGKRNYLTICLEPTQLRSVYECVLHGIGLGDLTFPA